MSEFKCEVVKVGPVGKHPNADTLGIVHVWGYPCIVKLGELVEGDLAVYIPIDAIVDTSRPEFSFLGRHPRIKAKKLRGVFSMGMLIKATPGMNEGDDVASLLNIKKWEEPDEAVSQNGNLKTGGDNESVPFFFINYDVSNYRRYAKTLQPNEEVVITEKIHGCNSRFVYHNDRLYVGSHNSWKKQSDANMWWKLAKMYDLEEKLKRYPNYIFYGEAYGWVQDLHYGHKSGEVSLKFFDIFDLKNGKWLDYMDMADILYMLHLPIVPALYAGPWNEDLLKLADKVSALMPEGLEVTDENMREGIVISPMVERFDQYCGRPKLKYVSERYLLRHEKNKNVTEKH